MQSRVLLQRNITTTIASSLVAGLGLLGQLNHCSAAWRQVANECYDNGYTSNEDQGSNATSMWYFRGSSSWGSAFTDTSMQLNIETSARADVQIVANNTGHSGEGYGGAEAYGTWSWDGGTPSPSTPVRVQVLFQGGLTNAGQGNIVTPTLLTIGSTADAEGGAYTMGVDDYSYLYMNTSLTFPSTNFFPYLLNQGAEYQYFADGWAHSVPYEDGSGNFQFIFYFETRVDYTIDIDETYMTSAGATAIESQLWGVSDAITHLNTEGLTPYGFAAIDSKASCCGQGSITIGAQ